ncbi:hypothetical protein [Actinoallomurus liliacearum]|uniref:hypothetical protein n=1 Tax=Actinoallomurus liliacearum TaxID=1080073 RepID=UPI003CD06BBE
MSEGELARREDGDDRLGQEMAELVGRLSDDEIDNGTRGRLLGRLARLLAARARRARAAGLARGRWLTDVVAEIGPHIPVRDLQTLRAHHQGLTGERLADSLVRAAQRATTAVGATGGALAAVEFVTPPLLLSAPAQIVAETVAVAAIEVKLIAELHEVYGVQVPGSGTARGAVFLQLWAQQRGFDPLQPGSVAAALGLAARTGLRKRLMRTLGRHLTTMGPFLTGAVAGGTLNRTATRRLADTVRKDLRRAIGAPAPRPGADEDPA